MADVRFEQATRTYPGSDLPAVDALDLDIADGELMVLVGPSGSGKTTALRMLAGLEEVDAGAVMIGGRDVSDDPPKRRDVAMVFQNYALYPYLTVAANIGFPLRMARMPKGQREARVREVAEMLELTPYLERKPGQLSGGQRQRVAMGRAIVREPQVFLMDEPLSNLDAKLRVQMRADIAELQARLGVTTVYVTHDQAEAMTLGHRVAVLRDARLQQCDTPRVLFDRPVNIFVAGFVGSPSMNLCRVPLRDDGAAAFGALGLELPGLRANGRREAIVGVRPEAMELAGDGLDAGVELVEELGSDAFVYCSAELAGMPARLVARVPARHAPGRGGGEGRPSQPARRPGMRRSVASGCGCAPAQSTHRRSSTPRRASGLARSATPTLLRDLNERTVLEAIRAGAPISRAEISRRVGISKPTVSVTLESLLEAGLVREADNHRDGPKYGATFFEPVHEAALVLGLDVGARFLRGAICDLRGEVRARQDIETGGASALELLDAAAALKDRLVEASDLPTGAIDGVVVGLPGVVHPRAREVRLAEN